MKPVTIYYNNGQLQLEEWRNKKGKYHRLNGPARQWWDKNGNLEIEEWRVNGKRHRLNGPAYQEWYWNGQLLYEDWCIDGNEYKKTKHPFNIFREEHALQETYEEWPNDMKVLFEVIYK